MPLFSDINFKYTDAKTERQHAPDLLRDAYVDVERVSLRILEPERFIVYGPKGSGKTALAARLTLLTRARSDWHALMDDLESFEYDLLTRFDRDHAALGGPLAIWKTLLTLRVFSVLSADPRFASMNPDLVAIAHRLRATGLTGREQLTGLVQVAAREGAFDKFLAIFLPPTPSTAQGQPHPSDPAGVYQALSSVLKRTRSVGHKYILLLDGLDYPLRKGKDNAYHIADLLRATESVNDLLASRQLDAKIVVLIRDEVLSALPDPNLAKLTTDHGLALHWYDNVRSPERTSLLKVIGKRATLAGFDQTIEPLLRSWLPTRMGRMTTLKYLLDRTRHLPRDVISLFRSLQELDKEPPFSHDDIFAALKNYSDWFFSELTDSLVGLVPDEVRLAMSPVLSEVGRSFSFGTLRESLSSRDLTKQRSAEEIAHQLFVTGWIANTWLVGSVRHYRFQHRGRHASFDPKKTCIVHPGLTRALNIT